MNVALMTLSFHTICTANISVYLRISTAAIKDTCWTSTVLSSWKLSHDIQTMQLNMSLYYISILKENT